MTARRTFRTDTAIPEIGALPGDIIVVRPDDPEKPVSVVRRVDREDVPAFLLGPYLRVLN
ncbi:MAG: hypothetical protein ACREM1_15565 [Longimicrobiales bacterium]